MWKPMLAGTVALALTSATLALAQQGPAQPPSPSTAQAPPNPPAPARPGTAGPVPTPKSSAEQPSVTPSSAQPSADQDGTAKERAAAARERQAEEQAETAGRIASLRAGLMLTDDQNAKWPAFEKAWRDFVKVRRDQWEQFRNAPRDGDPFARMQARADFAVARGTALKGFVEAAQPLYQSLDPTQQRRFHNAVFSSLMQQRAGFGPRWRDRDEDDRRGEGGRWSRGGNDDGSCPHGGYGMDHHQRMHGYWRDRDDDDDRPARGWRGDTQRYGYGDRMGPRWRDNDQMGPRGRDGMGPRMGQGWRDRNDADRDGDGDGSDDSSGRRGSRMGPDEERY